MATATYGTSHAAAQTKWLKDCFAGHLRNNMLAPLMDINGGSSIKIENVQKKAGDTFKYHFRANPAGTDGVSGDTALTGSALTLATDSVTIERQRYAVLVENYADSDQRIAIDMEAQQAMPMLEEWMASKVQYMIMNQLLTTSTGRTQNRYLYGAADANYDATEATALANVDATNDKLTLSLLSLAKRKAQLQDSRTAGKIRPTKVMLQNGRVSNEHFVFLGHPYAIRDLKEDDTNFKNRVQYREAQDFDVINGATFVGMYDGILIYEMFEEGVQMIESGAGAASIDVAHNLLLGADAAVMAYGNVSRPAGSDAQAGAIMDEKGKVMRTREITDHGGDVEWGITFVGGAKKLVNGISGTNEDNGVVHVYTSAVADA